ncbi:MAG: hypothetical protein QXY40_03225 [Candidatus Methanomethylicia archaeon]
MLLVSFDRIAINSITTIKARRNWLDISKNVKDAKIYVVILCEVLLLSVQIRPRNEHDFKHFITSEDLKVKHSRSIRLRGLNNNTKR